MQPIIETSTSLAADGHDIFIIKNSQNGGAPASFRLVISHGLTDKPRGWLSTQTAYYFARLAGMDVDRFGYYGAEPTACRLHECTSIADHSADLSAVVAKGNSQNQRTIVLAHSWGGLVAAMTPLSDRRIDGLILVDPTFTPGWQKETQKISDKFRVLNWGSSPLVREEYCQEAEQLAAHPQKMEEAVQKIRVPVLTILAGASQKPGRNRDGWHHALPPHHPKELITVPGADHEFTAPGTALRMLETAHDWVRALG